MQGESYHDRTDWWQYILQVPPPGSSYWRM